MRHHPGPIQCSLLYADPGSVSAVESAQQPDIFTDLNLEQVVAAVCASRAAYQLERYFYVPLHTEAEVDYRHEVLADFDEPGVAECISAFAEAMRSVRGKQAQAGKLHYRYQVDWWLLDATAAYCAAIHALAGALAHLPIRSAGLGALRSYVGQYLAGGRFVTMERDTLSTREQLAGIDYSIRVHGSTVSVDDYHDEADYSAEVLATFDRFKQGAVRSHLVEFSDPVNMNHVEAQILDRVALLYPEVFAALDQHAQRYRDCVDQTIANAERESQFYQAYLDFRDSLAGKGLVMSVPRVRDDDKEVRALDAFDVALAAKLVDERDPVVCNDITLTGRERIIVVSGPNQGGKTTFSRTFGQLHYLGSLGLPVPGRGTRLFLPDRIFTHYERGENLVEHRSKLEDELIRIHDILQSATSQSIVVINEIFTSTTLKDAIYLGTRVLRSIIDKDLLCVCVTFVDELAALSDTTVSMMSTVVPDNPAQRTFKVVRRPADGLAYAAAIADKYGLSYQRLIQRVAS